MNDANLISYRKISFRNFITARWKAVPTARCSWSPPWPNSERQNSPATFIVELPQRCKCITKASKLKPTSNVNRFVSQLSWSIVCRGASRKIGHLRVFDVHVDIAPTVNFPGSEGSLPRRTSCELTFGGVLTASPRRELASSHLPAEARWLAAERASSIRCRGSGISLLQAIICMAMGSDM